MRMLFSINGFILETYNFSILWNLVYILASQTILIPLGAYLLQSSGRNSMRVKSAKIGPGTVDCLNSLCQPL